MSNFPLLKKIAIILGWGFFSYLISQLLLENELTQKGFLILLLCAGLWMTEIIPLPVTALLVPVFAYFLGIFEPKSAMAPFASTIIIFNRMDWRLLMVGVNSIRNRRFVRLNRNSINK